MTTTPTSVGPNITVELVQSLVSEQFPQWASLSIKPVETEGWDNRTFRLGDDMSVRLPSAKEYALQVHKEQKWLPKLAPHLTFVIPQPISQGEPSKEYPWNWSIYKWIEGEPVSNGHVNDPVQLGVQLAKALSELHKIDALTGPRPGVHNFYRGAPPSTYDGQTRSAITSLQDLVDTQQATAVWDAALSSQWEASPLWVHGDFSAGNILVKDGQLAAIIDFGCLGVGDPACDLVIAWTFLTGAGRHAFKSNLQLDANTWIRARGWALWKALITLASLENKQAPDALRQQAIIATVLNES